MRFFYYFCSLLSLFGVDSKPEQIHMAQGLTPETMTISCVTSYEAESVVFYGLLPDTLNFKATGYSIRYSFSDFYISDYNHHITLNNLTSETTYYYRCLDSDINEFTTGPAPGTNKPYTFGVIGDIGQTTDTEQTINHLLANKNVKFILHAGDLAYADCNQSLWDSYGQMIEPLANKKAWMVCPGNHEIEYVPGASGQQLFSAFETRYRMPSIKPAEYGNIIIPSSTNPYTNEPYCCPSTFLAEYNYGNSFYSFEVGLSHIIYLNSYTPSDENSSQYQWLVDDFNSIDRSVTPWVIVIMHCPWYNSNKAHHQELQAVMMKESMEDLFYENRVNLVFTGHVHAYERTHPVYRDQVVSDGPVYITIGDGGNLEGHANTYYEQPEWSAYRNGTQYGYGTLTVVDQSRLIWKWFRNIDGKYIFRDSIIIYN